jgi:hypothetical protein
MKEAIDDRTIRSESNEEENWELVFNQSEETPSRRRFSEHERGVLNQLIHQAQAQ